MRDPIRRAAAVAGVAVVAGAAVVLGPAVGVTSAAGGAASCVPWTGLQPPNPGFATNTLDGVAVASLCRAWAVGYNNNKKNTFTETLIEAWNGTAWTHVASPNPGGSTDNNFLFGATAVSSGDAWAVGGYQAGTGDKTLIVHWNGTAWTLVPSPNPGSSVNTLNGVAATSSTDAWAVGRYDNASTPRTLIERWNGTAWAKVPSPSPGSSDNILNGVAATSSTDAWAVGRYDNASTSQTLIERWNGTAWAPVPSPSPGSATNQLTAVVAISAANAWAVGYYSNNGTTNQTLIVHWNGTTWTQVPSPSPGSYGNFLLGVGATSSTNIWAVGYYQGHGQKTLALHCC